MLLRVSAMSVGDRWGVSRVLRPGRRGDGKAAAVTSDGFGRLATVPPAAVARKARISDC